MSPSDSHDRSHGVPVRLATPRIAPVKYEQATAAQRQAIDAFGLQPPPLNIFATFARAPEALTAFRPWGSYVLSPENSLPPRDREIVILRIGARCRSADPKHVSWWHLA